MLEKKHRPKPRLERSPSHYETAPLGQTEQVAVGLNCIRCGLPLHIAASAVPEVVASLDRTGLVLLLCVCGHLQLVGFSQHALYD